MGLVFAEFLLLAGLALAIADKVLTGREGPGNRYAYASTPDEVAASPREVGRDAV
jgi:hypothetical protein